MITFTTAGSKIFIGDMDEKNIHKVLPLGTYNVEFDSRSEIFYLECREPFKEQKMYGNAHALALKTWNTYDNTAKSVGSVFVGDKGSGKTELAKEICRLSPLPIVIVSKSFDSADLTLFLSKLTNCVIFFDEFGKFYQKNDGHSNSQAAFLPFFDGTTQNKYMTIVTENDRGLLNQFLFFRPGRFRYVREYLKLPLDVVREYMTDMNCDAAFIEEVIAYHGNVAVFSFDILQAIVDENRIYGTGIQEISTDLNIPQQYFHNISIKSVTMDGAEIKFNPNSDRLHNRPQSMNVYSDDEDTFVCTFNTGNLITKTDDTMTFISKCRKYIIVCDVIQLTSF